MREVLPAASLLLTTITVLYSLWYDEIKSAKETNIPNFKEEYRKPFLEVKDVFWKKAVPLAFANTLLALVFLPDVISITVASVSAYTTNFIDALMNYNSAYTAFSLVVFSLIGLAIVTIRDVFVLCKIKNKLDE